MLVIDVTNFSDETNFHGSRESLHLIERFRRVDAEHALRAVHGRGSDDVDAVMDGGAGARQERTTKTTLVLEGGCHEGNYGLMGMLLNTRAAEKAFREGKGPDPATQDNATGGGDNSR